MLVCLMLLGRFTFS